LMKNVQLLGFEVLTAVATNRPIFNALLSVISRNIEPFNFEFILRVTN
jgi:hypothetical protein